MEIKHVTMLAEDSCGRVQKMTAAARAAGVERITLVTSYREIPGHKKLLGRYDDVRYYPQSVATELGQKPGPNAIEIIRRHLFELQPDVVHAHNEPNWIVAAALVSNVAPVVFDVHDLDLVRYSHHEAMTGARVDAERKLVEQSHAVIVPCKGYADVLDRGTVIYSMAEKRYVKFGEPDCDGILLMGHVSVGATHAPWLDYRSVGKRFADAGCSLYVQYGGRGGMTTENSGAVILQPCPYDDLMARMGHWRWGLVAGGVPCAQWNVAMPNKLFEYMACGVVPVVLWADEAADYVEKHGCGVVIASPEKARQRLTMSAWKKCRAAMERMRDQLAMESQASKLAGVYREAIEKWNTTGGKPGESAATTNNGLTQDQAIQAARPA